MNSSIFRFRYCFVVFVSLLLIQSTATIQAQNGDIAVLRKINLNRNMTYDKTFRFVSNSVTPVSFALPLSLIGSGLYTQDRVLTSKGFAAGAAVLLSTGLSMSLKYSVHRKRPYVCYDDIQQCMNTGPYSFPSGHTTAAFTAATSLSLAFPKWYVIAPSFAWAVAVGYSRMHLGVHFPSDVIAGMLLGIGSSVLCYQAQNWIKK
jgi:membrane-associated phospholipid phosphatase